MQQTVDGDGRTQVSLAELVSLRAQAGRVRIAPQPSRQRRSGQQSSRLYGRGMDYAESRVYQPGDDVRRLDWRLTARSGKLHTKLFQEDREGSLLILLDTHATMRFGTRVRYKSVQAARAAACAAWYAARAGERVGVMAFGHADELLRPQPGTRGALAVCGALAAWDAGQRPERVESLSDALARAGRVSRGATRVLLISDGFSCDSDAGPRLRDLTRHAGIGVLVVADALELRPVPAGRYPLEHAGARVELGLHSDRQRQAFQRALGDGPKRLCELAQSLALRWSAIDTAVNPLPAVTGLFGAARQSR